MTDYLDGLNEQQRAAVEYIDGPSLVIAGAGSGKTRVLTNKIAYLLDHGYEPWSILALTFTNKAANEMKERIAKQVGHERARYLWMGTFHSVFSRILRAEAEVLGFTSDFTIYYASDSKLTLHQRRFVKPTRKRSFRRFIVFIDVTGIDADRATRWISMTCWFIPMYY